MDNDEAANLSLLSSAAMLSFGFFILSWYTTALVHLGVAVGPNSYGCSFPVP